MCCGRDKSLPFSLCGESQGETPALTALSTITCSYSHTQELNPLIHSVFLAHINTYTNNNLHGLILQKKKKNTKRCFPPRGSCPFRSPFPFVLSCFHLYLLTSLLCTHCNTYICFCVSLPSPSSRSLVNTKS